MIVKGCDPIQKGPDSIHYDFNWIIGQGSFSLSHPGKGIYSHLLLRWQPASYDVLLYQFLKYGFIG